MLFTVEYKNLSIHQYSKGERFTRNLHNNSIADKFQSLFQVQVSTTFMLLNISSMRLKSKIKNGLISEGNINTDPNYIKTSITNTV
jgi:hypothetical protein